MKNYSTPLLVFTCATMLLLNLTASAQAYRTAATAALETNGREWIEKRLPPSVITFSDYSGLVEIKTIVSSLTSKENDSTLVPETAAYADFTMTLDKDQLPEQVAAIKTYNTTGNLTINKITKKVDAQYSLDPRSNTGQGYSISISIRFNPEDLNLDIKDEPTSEPLIVRVSNAFLNKQQNNF
ncbi:MAG: YceI family protein [Chitinophagaceae bacterium]